MLTVDSTRAFENQWHIWRLYGLNPPEGDSFWRRHYTLYVILINSFASVFVPLTFYIECLTSSSLSEFCETFYVAAIQFVQQLKLITAWFIIGRLKNLHVILHHLDSRLQSKKEGDIIRDQIRQCNQIFNFVMRVFAMIAVSANIAVLFNPGNQLAMLAWYPWNWQTSNCAYWLTALFQTLCIFVECLISMASDTYPVSYLKIVSGHYRTLALRISKLGNSNEDQTVVYGKLVGCIEDHKAILLLVDTLQDALSSVLFYQFAGTTSALCTLTFYVFFVDFSRSKILGVFFQFIAVFCETFIICYAAEEVADGAQQLTEAIYECNWMDQSLKFQRTLALMLNRSQRPVIITAARIVPVGMTTFLSVVKTAYSVFTLLNEVKS